MRTDAKIRCGEDLPSSSSPTTSLNPGKDRVYRTVGGRRVAGGLSSPVLQGTIQNCSDTPRARDFFTAQHV